MTDDRSIGVTLDDLLAAVLAAPDDDGPRAVYADALQEAGDPRGELIALQLERARTGRLRAATEKRERELLRAHAREWLHPIGAAIRPGSVRFARGFLEACRVEFKTVRQRGELLGHPLWSTVCEIDCDDWGFVAHEGLRSLRRATANTIALARMAAREDPAPLEAVIGHLRTRHGLRIRWGVAPGSPAAWGPALEVGALRHLRSLQLVAWGMDGDKAQRVCLTPADYAWLLDSRLGRQLEDLDLFGAGTELPLAPWIDALARRPPGLRVRLRFTNANTANGTKEHLVVYDLERRGDLVGVTMSVNQDMADKDFARYAIGGQIQNSVRGLPSPRAPALAVRYIGSKKRTVRGYPRIAATLRAAFATVDLD